jgi:hypothetical protein
VRRDALTSALPDAWCAVYENRAFTYVETLSGYRAGLPDPRGLSTYLPAGSAPEALGVAVLTALAASRVLHPSEDPEFFDMRGRVVPGYESWVKATMAQYGYKSRRAMFRDMKSCSVERQSALLRMRPSHHERSETWSGEGLGLDSHVLVPADSAASAVGAALRVALERCT